MHYGDTPRDDDSEGSRRGLPLRLFQMYSFAEFFDPSRKLRVFF